MGQVLMELRAEFQSNVHSASMDDRKCKAGSPMGQISKNPKV